MAIDPSKVPRFAHGSRVPGWDEAVDLTKDPAVVPDPATTPVPPEVRAEIEAKMVLYPDTRSAAIPALHIVQREHGWCTPTAIEQAACVLRLTPAYLTAVATFYDMFSTTPKGRHDVYVCTNISCSLLGADAIYEEMLSAAGDDPEFHVQSFECLGRVRHRADGVGRRRVRRARSRPRTARGSSTTSRPGARCCRTSSSRSARSRWSTGGRRRWSCSTRTSTIRSCARSTATRGAAATRCCARRCRWTPDDVLQRDARVRRPRPRRRRLRDGQEDVLHPQGDDGQVPRLQRRRVRARHVQGPRADAEEPASAHRGDDHRRLRDRRQQVVHLHPRRVLAPGRRARRRGGRGARGRLSGRATSSARRTRSTSWSTAGRAPTSAARRRRCSTRSRAGAATRA